MIEALATASQTPFVLRNVKIYPSPDEPPIERGSIFVRDGRIASVGPGASDPAGYQEILLDGCTVTAGFWNSHVHFTEPKWKSSGRKPAGTLNAQLRDMFTSRGFTTVVDTGSYPPDTLALRRRIDSAELTGPSIYTSGPGVYPPNGIPYYVRASIPFWLRPLVPQPSTPDAAIRIIERNLGRGAELVKLFTGSYVARGRVLTMPEPIARAASNVAHAHGRLAFSHPSNLEGTRVAIGAGVDVLAHPPDLTDGVDRSVVQKMVDQGMAMIPTLKMFADTVSSDRSYLDPIYEIVRQFRTMGGELLFGTDVGYLQDYTTDGEFRGLVISGIDPRGILRMLTTAPARRFRLANEVGAVTVGRRADLTVLDGDPMDDLRAFTHVRATIRGGKFLYVRS
ncbi:MAG: amidohydrolase family protein [Thermoplasmata archaeon]